MAFSQLRGGGFPGDPFHREIDTDTTPGTVQTLISETVATGKKLVLRRVAIVLRTHSRWVVELDGTVIASGRTGPASPNTTFDWIVGRPANPGQLIELKLDVNATEKVRCVEAFFEASEINN